MECSCQQEENFKEFHPHVGICTNITEAHIDFMKSFEHYKENKAKMFSVQNEADIAILNFDNDDVKDAMKNIKSIKKYFSSKSNIEGCHLVGDDIYYYNNKVMNINEIKIKGMHNVENVMAAIMAVKEYNVSNEIIKKVVSTFKGVEHRLEYVDTVNGVEYYNDTEATNIKCAQIALSSFKQPTIIFLGGMERGQEFDDLSPYLSNVKAIIAIGTCRERVKEFALKNNKEVYVYEFLKDGFDKAASIAKPGDVVLLSPGSASWDQYKECEVRGAEFKQKVKELGNN
jgi:UDP-N-acetylmuramoylalanine--D-glutamate ligase